MSFSCGTRLIRECFSDQLVILEAVARVQWHLFALPSDSGLVKVDVCPNLSKENSSNDKIAPKGVFIDDAFHSFAFASE